MGIQRRQDRVFFAQRPRKKHRTCRWPLKAEQGLVCMWERCARDLRWLNWQVSLCIQRAYLAAIWEN